MPALLELSRNRDALAQQLLRRIGYTEGLFRILRHADVLVDIAPLLPLSVPVVDVKLRESMRRHSGSDPSVARASRTYGEGVRNVLIALKLLRRTGAKLALAPRGRALVAIRQHESSDSDAVRALLAASVIDADGDYTLNLITEGPPQFPRNVELAISAKERMLSSGPASPARTFALAQLRRSRESLFSRPKAGRPLATSLVNENTLRHTIVPRQGWLRDLGLAPIIIRQRVVSLLRPSGQSFKGDDGQDVVALGLSRELVTALNLEMPVLDQDLTWRLVASIWSEAPSAAPLEQRLVEEHYAALRLRSFNQVEIQAVFQLYASYAAASGLAPTVEEFERGLQKLVDSDSSGMWRMASRRGGPLSGYIAIAGRQPE